MSTAEATFIDMVEQDDFPPKDETFSPIVPANQIYVPDVDVAVDAWNAYQNLCRKLLDDSDYAKIGKTKYRKRSGWAKLRRAFSITTTIIDHDWEDLGDGEFGFYVTVRATFPDGRCEDGDGYCDTSEFNGGGRRIAATRHNVRSKAITRAKNRATADLIGSGEVSAEEFIESDNGNVIRDLDWARGLKTQKGTLFGELSADQLITALDHTEKGSQKHKALSMLLDAAEATDD